MEVEVNGIPVCFPFEPYPAQVELLRSVIDCVRQGAHGLLESPTGTGKTLCLLCGALAWLEATARGGVLQHPKGSATHTRPPQRYKVVYCSRTHAQLTQVVRELKRTVYAQRFTMALLGSREHMCVNSEVTRLHSAQVQQAMCSTLRANRDCRFFRGLQSASSGASLLPSEYAVHDMEDLLREGGRNGFCPYYHERDAAKDADIVLMPYNYILDPSLHKQLPFELADCILIVDEAHNLPSVLSSAGCSTLSPLDVTTSLHDCSRAIAMHRLTVKKKELDEDVAAAEEQELASLKILLGRLETCLYAEVMAESPSNTASSTAAVGVPRELVRKGSYMFSFLEKAFITREVFGSGPEDATATATGAGLTAVMDKCVALLATSDRPGTSVVRVQEFLTAVFASDPHRLESTKFVLQEEVVAGKTTRTLGFWELDNTSLMRQVAAPLRSMLLTSGTLSPLDQFAAELGMDFPIRLKGSHVIQAEQVLGGVLCRGPSGEKLNGGFAFRSSVDYRVGLGMSLVNLARNTPGGTLVFFPSYTAMNSAVELWRAGSGRPGDTKTIWGLLSELKPIFVEPSSSKDLSTIVEGFQKEVDTSPLRGAVLLAVCRGKISEGVDFADHHGRCVMVTGIPYANHTDLFVRLKREYLTSVAPQRPRVLGKLFTGDDWYRNEAMRAVNQCAGRVIRHKDDFGVVLLADERFEGLLPGVSDWVRLQTSVFADFRGAYAAVTQFFANRRHRVTPTAPSPCIVVPGDRMKTEGTAVPSSAALAKNYADTQVRQREEEMQEIRRRRLEEVRGAKATAHELPAVSPAPIAFPFRRPTIPFHEGSDAGSSVRQCDEPLAAPHGHDRGAPPGGEPPQIGATSKEFCEYLKMRVPIERYHRFKIILGEVAALRPLLTSSPSKAAEGMAKLLEPLRSVFVAADAVHYRVLFSEFGQHIPEDIRCLYANLLKSSNLN